MSIKCTQVSLSFTKRRLKLLQTQARQIYDSRNITMARQKELRPKRHKLWQGKKNYDQRDTGDSRKKTKLQHKTKRARSNPTTKETQTISLISNCKNSNHSTYFLKGSNHKSF